ncbi:hypothetical protein INT43_000008 [Umbelopsis isabellina]|uniref:Uncharacterized protein n=1 Tax=Mortierella isabellina TaxID=91625 RepID=A0A8H7PEW9_MORIS|nr:hypothetical protein INT43_000008 [Umbelopsis isabellina]
MCHITERCTCVAFSHQEHTKTPSPNLQSSNPPTPHDAIDEADVKLTEDKVVDDELWKAVMSDIDTIFDDSKAT